MEREIRFNGEFGDANRDATRTLEKLLKSSLAESALHCTYSPVPATAETPAGLRVGVWSMKDDKRSLMRLLLEKVYPRNEAIDPEELIQEVRAHMQSDDFSAALRQVWPRWEESPQEPARP
jgi:hypothetical protein